VAGAIESPVYAILQMNHTLAQLDGRDFGGTEPKLKIYNATMPFSPAEPSMKWDGEWQVTIEVFRDLAWRLARCSSDLHADGRLVQKLLDAPGRDDRDPVLPGRRVAGALGARRVFHSDIDDRLHAGAGIVVRNSIILVDFIELRSAMVGRCATPASNRRGSVPADDAYGVGGDRGRAGHLADPIFQGLAISLLFGAIASLLISPLAVPLIYYMTHAGRGRNPPINFVI